MRPNLQALFLGLTILCSINLIAQGQEKYDSVYFKKVIETTQNQLTTLNTTLTQKLQASQGEVERLSGIITDSKTQSDAKIKALSDKLTELDNIQKIKSDNDKEQTKKRFNAGKSAMLSMKSGVKLLNFTYKTLDLDQTIELTTNIWSDSTFRNAWNKVEDWGTIAGAVIAVGGFANSSESSSQIGGLTIGAGVVGVSKLLGTLFGINEKKFRKKMEKIDLSIRAYDDLNMRNKLLNTFINNNKDFETRITAFETEYNKANDDNTSLYLSRLVDLLDEYKSILKQLPSYIDEISTVSVSYINSNKYKELPMKDVFSKILDKCADLKESYKQDVKPLLDVSPEIKSLILGIN